MMMMGVWLWRDPSARGARSMVGPLALPLPPRPPVLPLPAWHTERTTTRSSSGAAQAISRLQISPTRANNRAVFSLSDPSTKCQNCFCCARMHFDHATLPHPRACTPVGHIRSPARMMAHVADVCDAPASGCPKWAEHCRATHKHATWRQAREDWRKRQACPQPAATLPLASRPTDGSASSSSAAVLSSANPKPLPRRASSSSCPRRPAATPSPSWAARARASRGWAR